jgi:plasmid stabilization system protein ParE
VARLIYSGQAVADLERVTDFLIAQESDAALATLELIEEALAILRRHPYIGRQVDDDLHELVISRGKTGYVALYRIRQS